MSKQELTDLNPYCENCGGVLSRGHPGQMDNYFYPYPSSHLGDDGAAKWLSDRLYRIEAQLELLGAPPGVEAFEIAKQIRDVREANRRATFSRSGLSLRTQNALLRTGLSFNAALAEVRKRKIRNLGQKGIKELEDAGLLEAP